MGDEDVTGSAVLKNWTLINEQGLCQVKLALRQNQQGLYLLCHGSRLGIRDERIRQGGKMNHSETGDVLLRTEERSRPGRPEHRSRGGRLRERLPKETVSERD